MAKLVVRSEPVLELMPVAKLGAKLKAKLEAKLEVMPEVEH